jgi:hypothetical protein
MARFWFGVPFSLDAVCASLIGKASTATPHSSSLWFVFCSVPACRGLPKKISMERLMRSYLLHLPVLMLILVTSIFSQVRNTGPKRPSQTRNAASQAPQRDPAAVAAIQAAILALGGTQMQGLDNCIAQGQVQTNGSSGTFKWEESGAQFHYEETVGSSTSMVVRSQGSPASLIDSKVMYFPPHLVGTMFFRPLIGVTLTHYYTDSTVGLAMASTNNATSPNFQVEVSFPQDGNPLVRKVQQEWTVDSNSGLPKQVHQWVPGYPIANFIRQSDTYFSNYALVNGVQTPTHFDEYLGGNLISSYDIASMPCGQTINPSDFILQGGGQ